MSDGREVLAHLSIALGRYLKELSREGRPVPPELAAMLGFCADLVRVRQDATPLGDPAGSGESSAMTTPVLTKREAAHALRCSVRTVERLISTGALSAIRVGQGVRIRRADLDGYLASLAPRSFRDDLDVKDTA